jgi:hypothetical protein
VWFVADTDIVVEIIKKHVGNYFYFRYRKKRRQTVREFDNDSHSGKVITHDCLFLFFRPLN